MSRFICCRTRVVLSGLAVCLVLGALASSCHDTATGKHLGGGDVGALPIGDISGGWVVSIYTKDDGCDPQKQFTAEIMVVLVIQGGNDVQIVAEDGSDLPDVVGGSIQGTLVGDQLEFSFTLVEDSGTR